MQLILTNKAKREANEVEEEVKEINEEFDPVINKGFCKLVFPCEHFCCLLPLNMELRKQNIKNSSKFINFIYSLHPNSVCNLTQPFPES